MVRDLFDVLTTRKARTARFALVLANYRVNPLQPLVASASIHPHHHINLTHHKVGKIYGGLEFCCTIFHT